MNQRLIADRLLQAESVTTAGGASGFTLIEVVVALVVFLIGVLGISGLLVSTIQANRGATNRSRADELLYEKVEEFQSTSYAGINGGTDTSTVEGVVFTREWTVNPSDPIAGVMTIDLTARWTERGDTFQIETSTMRSAN